jgi:NAD+ diphosphatase
MSDPIAFAGSPLDRCAVARRDAAWIEGRLSDPATRFLPLWKLDPLVKVGDSRALAWARRELFDDVELPGEPVLLGLAGDVAHFAVDVSSLAEPLPALGLEGVAKFEELRGIGSQLTPAEVAIVAHARSVTDWHRRHRHCAECGGLTVPVLAGAQRRCPDCSAEHFPRTDPVAIAAVVRGDRCLLGRGHHWPDTMYSALAGFVEPGETVEEAVRREVCEESGVVVGEVRYVKSQPWPFPSSLMIACVGEALTDELVIDTNEIEAAIWVDRAEMREAINGRHPRIGAARKGAIARSVLDAWSEGRIPDFD